MTRRLLFIYAHPDDESFGVAGVARINADRGAEIAIVTATRGDAGRAGEPPICSREDLPARREAELREAASLLGIGHVRLLDYLDKHLAEAPPDKIRGELVEEIRRHRPQVVVTFDPNGANQHPDHVAIARFAMDAIAAAADPRWLRDAGPAHRVQRLLWTSPVMPWDAPKSRDLRREPGVDFVIDTSKYVDVKAAALRAHRTQHVSISRHFFDLGDLQQILSVETFRQGFGPNLAKTPEDDIFASIVDRP
ncbi:MAG: PIG-L family deacetylase [Acidobacteria bacterium]|nr:PIG-L family deacetylase [Acidobacteriota bacterium]